MNKFKYFIIMLTLLYTSNCISQSLEEPNKLDFYVVDTITISNPVVFYKHNQSGKYVSSLEHIKAKDFKLKKAINNGQLFIYSNSLYGFLSQNDFDKYHYPDYGNCTFKEEYFKEIKGVVYQKFKEQPNKFVLALINVAYYNRKVQIYGKKSTIFEKYGNAIYYRIAFPLCE